MKPEYQVKALAELPLWIESALSFGTNRKLIVTQDPKAGGFFAILDFGDLTAEEGAAVGAADNLRIGANGKTSAQALERLNLALMEDAADDMVKAGVV